MEINQKLAIDFHQADLCEVLHLTTEAFLSRLQVADIISYSERDVIKNEIVNSDKILRTLHILKHKAGGFPVIIKYLTDMKMSDLAEKLESTAVSKRVEKTVVGDHSDAKEYQSALNEFIGALVKFYLGNFRAVESFGGDSEPIESVWVDIQMKEDKSSTANYSDIFTRMRETHCRTTVIEGQPGSGKTTLVKKIAYDWAKHKSSQHNKNIPFDLILVVPLRSAQSGTDLLQVAVRHLMGENTTQTKVWTIADGLRNSDMKILLILDGLDEWEMQPTSPLTKIFGSAVNRAENKQIADKIEFEFDLMITSRPYACDVINENFLVTRWKIMALNEARQSEFVNVRCKTQLGRNRAAEYLKKSTVLNEIGRIPLLLLLICYLADQNIEVPTNLTRLYEAFVRRMLIRSVQKGTIGSFYQKNWRQSELIANVGRLALLGVVKNKFVFSKDEMEMCQVKDESFASGLLLFRSDPLNQAVKSDFAHRSIQEFLAALYSVEFWATNLTITDITGWPEAIWPIEEISEMKVEMLEAKMIPIGDSQFCRFYFGLFSGQPGFDDKIRKSLEEYVNIRLISSHFLFCLSNSLADCSDAECVLTGEILNSLVDKCFNWTKSGWTDVQAKKENILLWTEAKRITGWPVPQTTQFRPQLQCKLKLKWLGNSFNSFYLTNQTPTKLKLIYIWLGEENLFEKLRELQGFEVEWLWIGQSSPFDFDKLKLALEVIKLLPKCRNCRIEDVSAEYLLIRLWLAEKSEDKDEKKTILANSGHSGINPEFLYVGVGRNLGEKIFSKLLSLRMTGSSEVEIESVEEFNNRRQLRLIVSSSWSVWDFLRNQVIGVDERRDRCSLS